MHDSPISSDDPLDFAPVPTAARHDGWTPERQRAFITALAAHGGVSAAARAVGMTPQSANRLRKRAGGEGFARAWDVALDEGRFRMRDEAYHRAMHGHQVPIRRNGAIVGYCHRHDDRLLMAALRPFGPGAFQRREGA